MLFDHMKMKLFSPKKYLDTVRQHLLQETEEQILPWIMLNVNQILKHDLANLRGTQNTRQKDIRSVVKQKIDANFKNASMRNLLLDFYIQLTDA